MLKKLANAFIDSLNRPMDRNKYLAEQSKLVKRAVRTSNLPYVKGNKK